MNQPLRMTVFVPLTHREATTVRDFGQTPGQLEGYAPTIRMAAAHDYSADEEEDAAYTAQVYARVAGLARAGGASDDISQPVVVAADIAADAVSESPARGDYGAVGFKHLAWDDVTAVFVEEPDAAPAVHAAVSALTEATTSVEATTDGPEDWLALPAVHRLIADHEQLWHHPAEIW